MLLTAFLGRDHLPFNMQIDLCGSCVQFSAYLHLFVCIYNVPVPKEMQIHKGNNKNTTDLLEKTKHWGYCKKTADLLYRQRMRRKNAETLGQTPSAEPGGSSP